MNFDSATRSRLVGVFVSEAEEVAAELRRLAGGWQGHVEPSALRDFGRSAHGLKGAAASLGYDGLARALHALEDVALRMGSGDAAVAETRSRIEAALDLLDGGIARMVASRQDGFPEDLLAGLLEILGRKEPGREAGAPPAAKIELVPTAAPAGVGRSDANGGDHDKRADERINVPAAEIDAALRLASSLARGASQLQEALQHASGELGSSAQSLAVTAGSLEEIIASIRLIPAEAALSGLEAEVEELAARLGKHVVVTVDGREVRADRRTLQAARVMIRHLVRNALDHGIEPPAERAAAGKPEEGHLRVQVAAGESVLRVSVSDDGCGFDTAAIRADLTRRAEDGRSVASLSDEDVIRAWALEGGSTRSSATEISGRGLGLSAVVRTARAAGGGASVRSARGEGSVVEFTLPLEVYAVEALVVQAGGRLFGIPLAAVERTVHIAGAGRAIQDGPTGRTLAVGETILPVGLLAEALGIAAESGRERFAVVVRSDDALAALAVDEVGSVDGMVPSTVPGVAQADALATGLARLGDGSAVALLNPRLLVSAARVARKAVRSARPVARAEPPGNGETRSDRLLDVLLAEDSLATREVLRVLLEGQGFRVRVAADGEEALQRIAESVPDVVVSDVNMPRRDGLSLTRALRGRFGTSRLPIVLLTSLDDDATRAAGAAAGADAYLVKSTFNADVLAQTLARIGVRAR